MKLAVIVTDFPKVTETFVLRDLMYFNGAGHQIRVYHITRFRRKETIHEFARPVLGWARYIPYLLSIRVLTALVKTAPGGLFRIARDIGVRLWRHPLLLAKSLALLPKAVAIGDDLAKWGADHVHAEFAGHPATCAWIVNRSRGIPYSVSCHAAGIFRNQALLGVTLGEAGAIRCISEYNRTFLAERIPELARTEIDVIHVGLDLSEFSYARADADVKDFRILYVGSLTPKKGVRHLLAALPIAARDIDIGCCEIIGSGPENDALRREARTSGLDARIRFLGPLSAEHVRDAMRRASVLVVPSVMGPGGRAEGIPTVLMEAMALGLPVIATRLTGIPELVQHDVNGLLVNPGDENALAAALLRLRNEPDLGPRLAQAARRTVEDGFDLSKTASCQLEMFEQVSGQAR